MILKKLRYLPLFLISLLHADSPKAITFDEAVSRAVFHSPVLKASGMQIEEKAGGHTQAGLLPNPIFSYSVENIFGNKDWNGWESAESRYEVGQLVELGGKRGYRISAAEYHFYAAEAGFEASKLDLLNRLMKTFVLVVSCQEQLKISQDQKNIAEQILNTVIAKVEAGKVSLMQQYKAEISLKHATITLEKAVVKFQSAKERLSLLWGETCPDFDFANYPFYEIEIPRCFLDCLHALKNNPELIQSQYDHMAAHENWNLEKAQAVPDVTLLVGYKTLRDTGNKGMILGAALPIPVFNRNQGNVQSAAAEILKTQEQVIQMQLLLENKLSLSHLELTQAYQEALMLETGILASATQTLELAQEGYQEGKFEYLDLLDAQRTLFEVKENYIQSLLRYHQKRADIEYLTSRITYE